MAKKKAKRIKSLENTLLHPGETNEYTLELDELWSFVHSKENKVWIWVALCRETRQVVSFAIGDRSEKTCRRLWDKLPPKYKSCQAFADFWDAYQMVWPKELLTPVGKESGQTAHIERWNNTLRQRLGRFVRKTLSFSKKIEMHFVCLFLFIYRYNKEIKESV